MITKEARKQEIARKLKNLRIESGLTQLQVAEKLGITYQAVSNYERGKNEPDNQTLLKLAEIFNVSTDCILGGAPDHGRPKLRMRVTEWKSDKSSRLYMCIDSGLLDLIDIFAKKDEISLEDEIEKILHEEAENRTEEETSKAADHGFAGLSPDKLYPHWGIGVSSQALSSDSMDGIGLEQSKPQPEQQKKPTPVAEDGLAELFRQYAQELTPNQQLMLLERMQQLILERMQRLTGQQKAPSSVFAQQITDETTP